MRSLAALLLLALFAAPFADAQTTPPAAPGPATQRALQDRLFSPLTMSGAQVSGEWVSFLYDGVGGLLSEYAVKAVDRSGTDPSGPPEGTTTTAVPSGFINVWSRVQVVPWGGGAPSMGPIATTPGAIAPTGLWELRDTITLLRVHGTPNAALQVLASSPVNVTFTPAPGVALTAIPTALGMSGAAWMVTADGLDARLVLIGPATATSASTLNPDGTTSQGLSVALGSGSQVVFLVRPSGLGPGDFGTVSDALQAQTVAGGIAIVQANGDQAWLPLDFGAQVTGTAARTGVVSLQVRDARLERSLCPPDAGTTPPPRSGGTRATATCGAGYALLLTFDPGLTLNAASLRVTVDRVDAAAATSLGQVLGSATPAAGAPQGSPSQPGDLSTGPSDGSNGTASTGTQQDTQPADDTSATATPPTGPLFYASAAPGARNALQVALWLPAGDHAVSIAPIVGGTTPTPATGGNETGTPPPTTPPAQRTPGFEFAVVAAAVAGVLALRRKP